MATSTYCNGEKKEEIWRIVPTETWNMFLLLFCLSIFTASINHSIITIINAFWCGAQAFHQFLRWNDHTQSDINMRSKRIRIGSTKKKKDLFFHTKIDFLLLFEIYFWTCNNRIVFRKWYVKIIIVIIVDWVLVELFVFVWSFASLLPLQFNSHYQWVIEIHSTLKITHSWTFNISPRHSMRDERRWKKKRANNE